MSKIRKKDNEASVLLYVPLDIYREYTDLLDEKGLKRSKYTSLLLTSAIKAEINKLKKSLS